MTLQEYLKALYGDKQTMTLEELTKAAETYQDAKFVDLKTGDYVDKGRITDLQGQLDTANQTIKNLKDTAKKWDGKDPDQLSRDLSALQEKYDADIAATRLSSAIDLALAASKSKDPAITRGSLKLDGIKLDGDKLIGLDEQLKALKEKNPWMFEAEDQNPPPFAPGPGTGNPGGAPAAPVTLAGALKERYNSKG